MTSCPLTSSTRSEPSTTRSCVGYQNSEALINTAPPATVERRSWNNRFANLVSGRFSELLFARTYNAMLGDKGLELRETTAEHDWLDYLIVQEAEKFSVGINVKNAGVQFETAQDRVGLAYERTLYRSLRPQESSAQRRRKGTCR